MRNLIVVMAHGGAAATVERHKKYWEPWGEVVYLVPANDTLPGDRGIQWAYGVSQHAGFEVNRKVLLGLQQAVKRLPDNIIFLEYDAFILGNDNSWLYKIPDDTIWCPAFRDIRDNRGFVGTTFTHPPLVMGIKVAGKLIRAMEAVGVGVESGFWDRYVGLVCEQYGIKIQNMWDEKLCYARNPIEGQYLDAACDAVRNGAIFIHGIKDEPSLRRIEQCVPVK